MAKEEIKEVSYNVFDGRNQVTVDPLTQKEAQAFAYGYRECALQYAQFVDGDIRIGKQREAVRTVIFPRIKIIPAPKV